MATMLVRLKPFAPRHGQKIRRYMAFGIRFDEGRGWYEVPKKIADYLRAVKNEESDPNSPFAFDVCTSEEAGTLEEDERKRRAEEAAKAAAPHVVPMSVIQTSALTAADLEVASSFPPASPAPLAPPAPPAPPQVERLPVRAAVPPVVAVTAPTVSASPVPPTRRRRVAG